jgi:polyisoprenoid-binding protein YceI
VRRARAAAVAWLLAAPQAIAAPEEFTVDPTHTYPGFAVVHLGISTQRGRFDRTTGTIVIDREAGKGSIEITIDTPSISTGSPKLDAVLRSDDFFDVEKHPRIVFKSSALELENGMPKRAVGELTLLGVAKPVTLAIEHFGCTRLPFFVRQTCGADVSTTLSRSAFGMNRFSTFIADDVKIIIQIEAVKVESAFEPPPAGG